jgi:hypothetical protein
MVRTVAMQAGVFILLFGLAVGSFGSQAGMLLLLAGASLTSLMLSTVAAPRRALVPVRVRRGNRCR